MQERGGGCQCEGGGAGSNFKRGGGGGAREPLAAQP